MTRTWSGRVKALGSCKSALTIIGACAWTSRARAGRLVGVVLMTVVAPVLAPAGAALASSGSAPVSVDGGNILFGVACPSTSQCTGVDYEGGEVTFDPTAPGNRTRATIDPSAAGQPAGVACPSTSQCTVVGFNGAGSVEVTFNPAEPGSPTPTTIGPGDNLTLYDSSAVVACPSTRQCTAIGSNFSLGGQEVTFDPAAPGAVTPVTIDSDVVTAVACPSASQCTAVGYFGREVTFNPAAPGSPTPTTIDPSGEALNGVACPSTNQCTAVDQSGLEITFDPAAPDAATSATILRNYAVVCPSRRQCTAVGPNGAHEGQEVTFDPTAPGSPEPATIDTANPINNLDAVACPSTTQCTAVDEEGEEVTFGPLPQTKPPMSTGRPVVTGKPKAGERLTCSAGTWTNAPKSFTYQWNRNGSALDGATSPAHVVDTLDEGATLTCTVTAKTSAGSASATSKPVKIPIPFVAHCPGATGSLSGSTIGLIHLGMTRSQARRAYAHHSNRGRRYEDFFCLTPIGVRVGYPSPKLLEHLPSSERRTLRGTVVWASTSNPHYSLDGVRAGDSIAKAATRLHTTTTFHIGLNDWYLARQANLTAVLKVRHGQVQEVGIAVSALTATRQLESTLMHSFY